MSIAANAIHHFDIATLPPPAHGHPLSETEGIFNCSGFIGAMAMRATLTGVPCEAFESVADATATAFVV